MRTVRERAEHLRRELLELAEEVAGESESSAFVASEVVSIALDAVTVLETTHHSVLDSDDVAPVETAVPLLERVQAMAAARRGLLRKINESDRDAAELRTFAQMLEGARFVVVGARVTGDDPERAVTRLIERFVSRFPAHAERLKSIPPRSLIAALDKYRPAEHRKTRLGHVSRSGLVALAIEASGGAFGYVEQVQRIRRGKYDHRDFVDVIDDALKGRKRKR